MDIIRQTTQITYSPQHLLLIMPIEILIEQLKPVRWIHNRPADETRVVQMAASIYRNRSVFDTIIYLHYNSVDNRYEILDGLHRYSACKHIYDNNSRSSPDYITGDDYGHGRSALWFYNAPIIISLHIDKTPGELHVIFENLNKAVPVSEIYIPSATNIATGTDLRKQKVMETAVEWQRQYPKHFSASNMFQIPNMNRDRFMDILAEIYDIIAGELDLNCVLCTANAYFHESYGQGRIKLSESVSKKCYESGCWLFIYKGDVLIQKIVNVVQLDN